MGPLALSFGAHAAIVAGLIIGATVWKTTPPRAYVVNLVPAIPAVGVPTAKPAPPAPKPQPEEPPPRVSKTAPEPARPKDPPLPDLPTRVPPVREVTPPPAPPRDIPARDMPTREMPARDLPPVDRSVPPRPSAMTRAGDKELPALPRVADAPRPTPLPPISQPPSTSPQVARTQPAPPPPPPQSLGQPTGSSAGSGALTITSSGNFPFTWYLQRVTSKVHERWAAPHNSHEGQIAVVVFEIGRDGKIAKASVEKTSGNTSYDLAALRAVSEASPFPPLPDEFKEPPLRVHLGIQFSKRG